MGSCSAFVAELWGVMEDLNLARAKGYRNVVLNLDLDIVVRILQGHALANTSGASLIMRIKKLLTIDWNVCVSHIFREANKCADVLANLGCEVGSHLVIFERLPVQLAQVLLADVMGVSTPRLVHV